MGLFTIHYKFVTGVRTVYLVSLLRMLAQSFDMRIMDLSHSFVINVVMRFSNFQLVSTLVTYFIIMLQFQVAVRADPD